MNTFGELQFNFSFTLGEKSFFDRPYPIEPELNADNIGRIVRKTNFIRFFIVDKKLDQFVFGCDFQVCPLGQITSKT